jgi:hypothetical protein
VDSHPDPKISGIPTGPLSPIRVQKEVDQADPLASLRARFDERFAQMQAQEAKDGVLALFSAGPTELGMAAVKGRKK